MYSSPTYEHLVDKLNTKYMDSIERRNPGPAFEVPGQVAPPLEGRIARLEDPRRTMSRIQGPIVERPH